MAACPRCGAVFCYCDQEDARPAIPLWVGFAIAALIVLVVLTGCGPRPRRVYPPVTPAPLPGELQPQQNPGKI